MDTRILTGWTFTRLFYLMVGAFLVFQSALDKQWAGVILGGYFAAMGLFAFGCASGRCYQANRPLKEIPIAESDPVSIEFEEVIIP